MAIIRGLWPLPFTQYKQARPAAKRWRLNRYRVVHCEACAVSEYSPIRILTVALFRYLPWRRQADD